PAPESVTALRLRLTLEAPGREPTTVERDLFDALGSARRAGGDLAPSTDEADRLAWRLRLYGERELLITAGGIDPTFVGYLASSALLAAGPSLSASVSGEDASSPQSSTAIAPGALHALALWGQRATPSGLYQ